MKNIDKIKLKISSSLKQALKTISEGAMQIALVVDDKNKLIGTLTDGDIRRGLLKGMDINSSIKSIVFKKPIIVNLNDTKKKILKKALSKKIHQIPVVDNKKKVKGIYIIDELMQPKKRTNKVILMVGGRGSRLKPLTNNIPKPMLKVGSKPVLHTIVENFVTCGYQDIVMCLNYGSKIIQDYFDDGSKFDANITYVIEKKRMGTAGALSLLNEKPLEPFFVMNGDLLTNLDFDKMLDFHNDHRSLATMCVREHITEVPYGVVTQDKGNIISVEEKPIRSFFLNAGIYILDPDCFNFIPNKFYDMPSLFQKMISKNKKVISFPLQEYWLDIGRFADLEKANIEYNSIFGRHK